MYERNLDLSKHTPLRRVEILKNQAESRAFKEHSVKRTKERLARSVIEVRKSKLILKESHFQMRNNPEVYYIAKRKWIELLILVNLPSLIYWKTMAKKRLRVRSSRHVNLLYWICKMIGKCRRSLRRIRLKHVREVRCI